MAIITNCFWQGFPVTNPAVLGAIQRAIEARGRFDVNNGTIGWDPAPGTKKMCEVRWRDSEGGPIISDSVLEGGHFNFGTFIAEIRYGDIVLNDSYAYCHLHQAWRDTYNNFEKMRNNIFAGFVSDRGRVSLNNTTLCGDPKPGQQKSVRIVVFDKDFDPTHNIYNFNEGDLWPPRPQVDGETQAKADAMASQAMLTASSQIMSYSSMNASF